MSYKLQSHRGAPIFSECPKCSTKKFQPYLEFFKKTIIANHVGKCNACEYHFQPYDYQRLECFIPDEVRIRSLLNQEKNNLFLNLSTNFGKNMAVKAMEMYSVGTAVSGKYTGASIFWYINKEGVCHDGYISLFDEENTRGKYRGSIRQILNIKSIETIPCLFGAHLLNDHLEKTVVIVESATEAIVSSCKHPEYLWISSRSPAALTDIEKGAIANRNVICEPSTWKSYG